MYDFKTFAQMNLDLIFQGFDRMPQPGEEVFAKRFTMQLGGGPIVCPIVLEQLGFRVRLGTFLGQDDVSNLCRRLLDQRGFSSYDEFAQDNPDPVVVTSVFSWEHDRGFLAPMRASMRAFWIRRPSMASCGTPRWCLPRWGSRR